MLMPRAKLVSSFYDDMDISDSSENASEFEDAQNSIENGNDNNDSYINELEERKKYVQEFINKSFQHFKNNLDFNYIHDQDMNYYQETYSYTENYDRPMLGPSEDDSQDAASNDDQEYDLDYDKEVNRLLDELEEEILQENSNPPPKEDPIAKNDYADPKREQYDDCYNEFPQDMHHVGPVPLWYRKMLDKKMKATRIRLEHLSNFVCFTCASTGARIRRMEQDHSTVFCKMDFPRHPPLNKPWANFWKFNCRITCKDIDKPNHAHTADCESVLLEHANTGVSTLTPNISQNEYPKFVMDAVELFQDFAIETTKNVPFLNSEDALDTVYEKPIWTELKMRSNYKNELMIIVRGKGVSSLINKLRRYFDSGPGRTSNVISVFCINQKWSQKKNNFPPTYITGLFKLRDKVGPISINYEPKTNMNFNSVEAIQLGKVIQDYASLTDETTLLDIGCNFGVLSLMMSHKCDRVIGLNTMHFINSEISQAEELKKFNNIHNVSFMGCDPKDILTKCSTIVKRCITVAVLNLSSTYGKSIQVMQALRDLPSIWKVIVYGSFDKEYHRNISLLTSKDDLMGEHYLPMQYCILDKSPSVENAFDVVVLFERKPPMTPLVKTLAPGSTVNVKPDSDIDEYGSLDTLEVRPIVKLEKGFGKTGFRPKKFLGGKPFIKYRGPLNKFGKFDSPMLPMDDEQPEKSKEKSKEKSPSPVVERKFDCSVLRQKPPPIPAAANKGIDRSPYPSIRKELQVKDLKRIYDSPSLPMPKEEPATNRANSPSLSAKEKPFDCSLLRKSKPFDSSVLRDHNKLPQQSRDRQPPLSHPFLSVKKEFQYSCPTPPRDRYPSPPPPPPPPPSSPPSTKHTMLDASQIKKEKDFAGPALTTVKAEPRQFDEEKEEGELSADEDASPSVPVKTEKIDPNYFVGFSEVSSEPVRVKPEPADSYEIPPVQSTKFEPEDMQVSPISDDIENMKTPIHNPRALSDVSSPLAGSTNLEIVDGFEFTVRANQSFLAPESNPHAPLERPNGTIKVKKEFAEKQPTDSDDEIKIIDERRSSVLPSKQSKDSEARIRVKSLDEIIKVKSEQEQNDDLRTLIEQRKRLQRKLDKDKEARYYKKIHGRSPSPDFPRKYRQQRSPSPPPPFRKYNRSPSPRERKYVRSPSPRERKYIRSPSPRERKYPIYCSRSPSPHARPRSPSGRKYRRSSPSPGRWIKRERSPSVKRSRRSPSPINGTRRRRSPPSPIRVKVKREAYSPPRYKREPLSPVSSKWSEKSGRSPPSPSSHKMDHHGRTKSPVRSRRDSRKRRSRSRSPVEVKRKRRSLSPISLSPSQTRKHNGSAEKKELKKKKKKTKSKSKSKSPSRTFKKKTKSASGTIATATPATDKHETHWDIPALRTLSSKSPDRDVNKSSAKGEAKTESVQIDQTEPVKQERTSRSRSRTPIPGVEDTVKIETVAE